MKAYATRISVLVVGFVMLLSLVAVLSVNAQENQDNGTGSGLSISPTRTELSIEPGKTETVDINVRNVTRGAIIAKPSITDFESDDTTGEPKLYSDPEKRNSASIEPFVQGLGDIPLQPGENKNVSYTISIPADAAPGAYYGAVTYRAVPADQADVDAGQVALTANVASLVLIEVSGDITEQIQVTEVSAQLGDKKGSFFTTKPDQAAITVKNNGNGFSKPFGTITLSGMSGKQIYSYEINNSTPRGNVLPKASRTFTDKIENISKPGRYTLTANISHGNGGEVITQEVKFWYVPVWLLVAIAVLLVGIAAGLFLLYRKQFAGRKKRR